ncbi:hypothetical protein ADIWIN_2010 [Winogradskyella psychrotolerans RS-3]|uniref:Uncharacterized protein n=1 Tax=Winogradskyella psychrotolerans RS-3 TaxID=641526 RepID=S7VU80_9FLAO|nr:DUF5606 domain-containing protein [Winogradskyella psychrotolerans]EPR72922.1 hypothetical protein ADIWIN_2010 [Winogradskyella psychrotolerans RS-3]
MSLDKILSISGKPGLFQIVTQTRTGAVVESLIDQKRITVGAHSNISILSEIAIYTLAEEVPLREVLKKVMEKEGGQPTSISHKDSKDVLEEFFFEVLPDYDEDRVYPSDIKKVVQWYNLLQKNNLLASLEESKDDKKASDEEE